jgi:hypothetical protein
MVPFSSRIKNTVKRTLERGRPRSQRRSRKLFSPLIAADGDVRVPSN